MSLVFSTNNRYYGIGNTTAPTFAKMWMDLKAFLSANSWVVTQSGFWHETSGNSSSTADIITAQDTTLDFGGAGNGGMACDFVWFVVKDPSSRRQLLFCRPNAIDSADAASAGNMLIAYSARSGFSTTLGHDGNAVAGNNPPIAFDMIWLHRQDTADLDLSGVVALPTNPNAPGCVTWAGETTQRAVDSTIWNMHACVETSSNPASFYFWITDGNTTLGFFCLDGLQDSGADTDPAVVWFVPHNGGISQHPANVNDTGLTVRGWINKPATFSSRIDFVNKINQNQTRFLSIVVPKLSSYIYQTGNPMPLFPMVPLGLQTTLHDAKDIGFPVSYFKYTPLYTLKDVPHVNSTTNPLLSMPNTYKGASIIMKLETVKRFQFDTLSSGTVSPNVRDRIVTGSGVYFTLPWSGQLFNKP